ncbi:hypothetical protein [Mycobacterium sp. URHB0021]|jgi:hypothetical protein
MVDPFDFSDFGPPRGVPTSPAGHTTLPSPHLDSKLNSGFDPFAADSPPGPAKPLEVFGATTAAAASPGGNLTVARPPLALFGLAITLAGAGAAVAGGWGGAPAAASVGWLLAGPFAIGILAVYTVVDTSRRTSAVYSAPSWTKAAYWTVVAVCMAGIAIAAWHLALWAGRW